jgi:Cu/Ag efflux protein CusF
MKTSTLAALAGLALLAALPSPGFAQKAVAQSATLEVTATIEAIDKTSREILIQGPDGEFDTIYAGPDVKRFDELKVGDKLTFRYSESVVYNVRKPGQAPAAPADGTSVTRSTGPRPGATIAEQKTATVKVKAVDMNAPSVTVEGKDGRVMSFRIADKKNLKGVSAGDTVEITYTKAVVISVK